MKVTKITAKMLKTGKACKEQVALFKELFPDGAKFTKANWKKAKNAELDILFCVEFLSPENLADYIKVRDSARTEHNKIRELAWAKYSKACGPAWTEYIKTLGSARDVYGKVRDIALFDLLKNQE
jgi:hypothetical protein